MYRHNGGCLGMMSMYIYKYMKGGGKKLQNKVTDNTDINRHNTKTNKNNTQFTQRERQFTRDIHKGQGIIYTLSLNLANYTSCIVVMWLEWWGA